MDLQIVEETSEQESYALESEIGAYRGTCLRERSKSASTKEEGNVRPEVRV